jgi:hypothetical protein
MDLLKLILVPALLIWGVLGLCRYIYAIRNWKETTGRVKGYEGIAQPSLLINFITEDGEPIYFHKTFIWEAYRVHIIK